VNDDIETLTETKDTLNFKGISQKVFYLLKMKKTSDELDLTVEHLLYGGESVIYILTKIVNMVFSNTAIPDSLKGGIGCPIY
jgi:hypothetical protein